ncbi:MAG: carboxypeptidase-like regulatory domain-containing protein [Candidatus Sericytochromatia bacterium]|nr:carboxypeptidase-like regulatory domain-containing protein [Candidatus Sericytochromatia bacterium]
MARTALTWLLGGLLPTLPACLAEPGVVPRPDGGQPITGEVHGFDPLTDRFVPLSGAHVRVQGASGEGLTDARGHYRLEGLSPGAHRLSVTLPGYAPADLELHVPSGQALEGVHVGLAPVAPTPRRLAQAGAAPAPQETLVVGVVSDPRGTAVAGARVQASTTSGAFARTTCSESLVQTSGLAAGGGIISTRTGHFAFRVTQTVGLTYVRLNASGETPGGIRLERRSSRELAVDENGPSAISLALQMDAFDQVTTPIAQGPVVLGGPCTLKVGSGLSARTDEFHVRIRPEGSSAQAIEVIPEWVERSGRGGDVWFRVPATLAAVPLVAQLVQFGLATSGWSPPFRASAPPPGPPDESWLALKPAPPAVTPIPDEYAPCASLGLIIQAGSVVNRTSSETIRQAP